MRPFILLLVASMLVPAYSRAAGPSRAQCECRPLSSKRDNKAYFAALDNASLCINVGAENKSPQCHIKIYCLSDGTGPACKDHPKKTGIINGVASGSDSDIKKFVDQVVKLYAEFEKTTDFKNELTADTLRDLLLKKPEILKECMTAYKYEKSEIVGKPYEDPVACAVWQDSHSFVLLSYRGKSWVDFEFSDIRQ